jgi:hypothetical protein
MGTFHMAQALLIKAMFILFQKAWIGFDPMSVIELLKCGPIFNLVMLLEKLPYNGLLYKELRPQ